MRSFIKQVTVFSVYQKSRFVLITMGGGTFFKVGREQVHVKKIIANFVVCVGNCYVTRKYGVITYTPYEGLNYTILDRITPL